MPPAVFNRLNQELDGDGIFVRRKDALQHERIHPLKMMVAALCMLAYYSAADSLNEYLGM